MDVVGRGVQKVTEDQRPLGQVCTAWGPGEALEERRQKMARSTYPSPSPLLALPASLQRKKRAYPAPAPHHHPPKGPARATKP